MEAGGKTGEGGSHHCGRGISLENFELSAPIGFQTVEGGEGCLRRSICGPKRSPLEAPAPDFRRPARGHAHFGSGWGRGPTGSLACLLGVLMALQSMLGREPISQHLPPVKVKECCIQRH